MPTLPKQPNPYLTNLTLTNDVKPALLLDCLWCTGLQGAEGTKRFNIHKAFGTHLLPSAHTCFNQLDLPEYPTEDITREKLLIAIREGSEGFGFA